MCPVHKGTSADLWRFACGVNLDTKTRGVLGGFYLPRNGWFIYYKQGYHGQFIYRVEKSTVMADYPKVLEKLRERSEQKKDAPPAFKRISDILKTHQEEISQDPEKFLQLIKKKRLEELKTKDPDLYDYSINKEQAFDIRWARIKRFWVNIVFEILFFSGLTLFIFWPWLRNKGKKSTIIHFGLFPFLLMLPYYLGYASWTFTSAGPSGGVLYPWVIIWFKALPLWTPIDQWILITLPKPLESISQSLGPMLSISGGGTLGPFCALVFGCLVSGIYWTFLSIPNKNKKEQEPDEKTDN